MYKGKLSIDREEEEIAVAKLLKLGANKKIQNMIHRDYSKVVPLTKLHKMKSKITNSTNNDLLTVVELLRETYNADVHVYNDTQTSTFEDGNGRGQIAGVGLLSTEERDVLYWMLQAFKTDNEESWRGIKCFMTDKDLTERDVIKELFPTVPTYICIFHTLKTFKKLWKVPT
ncbi:hypothetical protein KQX54_009659 [Cotesia glomerata]|uniref:ZSWIM1/3 RNaseH-like domain-containing protein n=1 Tax=Cotesia glomerata TaxID=32391 RepID=A0AAV7IYM0_COTGL|nr:hypothetical protein KQX54_009659 [Cotesia glomerata]